MPELAAGAAFPADALCRLAKRVVGGDVVFFIGSGFSIDSEGNTATRLMRRLLIRLTAFARILHPDVLDQLRHTFPLDSTRNDHRFPFSDADVTTLGNRYYESNEWFCVAFGNLLGRIKKKPRLKRTKALDEIHRCEEEIRTGGGAGKPIDDAPFQEIDPRLVEMAGRLAARTVGKALFLDTMGFRDKRIMGGEPELTDADAVLASYGSRLLPRHHIIARFAREGFCSTTITANFDLLLEGAFRVSGFRLSECADREAQRFTPPAYFDDLARITSPSEFFCQTQPHRTAVLVKMHGCAEKYRKCFGELDSYLPSMVFTYREIQNWRQDSWAADYLRTLLRTRTVVFCGYSLQDPVIHDTFRTVYEDMARQRQRGERAQQPGLAQTENDAPAFFLAPGSEMRREFHGMEVLQAATSAIGAKPSQFNSHPNYLHFAYRNSAEFPRLDEQLQWLSHAAFRMRQSECLKVYLARTVAGLLRRPRPDSELDAVQAQFEALWERENARANGWQSDACSRREHGAICNWTSQFHAGLMREFASMEMVHSQRGPSRKLSLMRELEWHYPTTAAGGWSCWASVVELALRNMIETWWGGKPGKAREPFAIRAAECLEPTVLFSPAAPSSAGRATPVALSIHFSAFERPGTAARIAGFPFRRISWELSQSDAPWPTESAREQRPRGNWQRHAVCPPNAREIWSWALGAPTPEMRNPLRLRKCLGLEQ